MRRVVEAMKAAIKRRAAMTLAGWYEVRHVSKERRMWGSN